MASRERSLSNFGQQKRYDYQAKSQPLSFSNITLSENAKNNGPIAEEESKDPIHGGNFLITKDVLSDLDKRPKNETLPVI